MPLRTPHILWFRQDRHFYFRFVFLLLRKASNAITRLPKAHNNVNITMKIEMFSKAIISATVFTLLRSVLNGCPPDIQHLFLCIPASRCTQTWEATTLPLVLSRIYYNTCQLKQQLLNKFFYSLLLHILFSKPYCFLIQIPSYTVTIDSIRCNIADKIDKSIFAD